MGRRKIAIEPITDERNRTVTFVKRKAGLFKKAYELAILCQVDIALVIVNNNNRVYEFSSADALKIFDVYKEHPKPYESKTPRDYGNHVKKSRIKIDGRHAKEEPVASDSDSESESESELRGKRPRAPPALTRKAVNANTKRPKMEREEQGYGYQWDRVQAQETSQPPNSLGHRQGLMPQRSHGASMMHPAPPHAPPHGNPHAPSLLLNIGVPGQIGQAQLAQANNHTYPSASPITRLNVPEERFRIPGQAGPPPSQSHNQLQGKPQGQSQGQPQEQSRHTGHMASLLPPIAHPASSSPPYPAQTKRPVLKVQIPITETIDARNTDSLITALIANVAPTSDSTISARNSSNDTNLGTRQYQPTNPKPNFLPPNDNSPKLTPISAGPHLYTHPLHTPSRLCGFGKESDREGYGASPVPVSGPTFHGQPSTPGFRPPLGPLNTSGMYNPTPHQSFMQGPLGENTPTSGLPSRYVNDLIPSPSNFYASEWNIPMGSGATPYPTSAVNPKHLPFPGDNRGSRPAGNRDDTLP